MSSRGWGHAPCGKASWALVTLGGTLSIGPSVVTIFKGRCAQLTVMAALSLSCRLRPRLPSLTAGGTGMSADRPGHVPRAVPLPGSAPVSRVSPTLSGRPEPHSICSKGRTHLYWSLGKRREKRELPWCALLLGKHHCRRLHAEVRSVLICTDGDVVLDHSFSWLTLSVDQCPQQHPSSNTERSFLEH